MLIIVISASLYADDIVGSFDNGRISWHWYESDSSLYVMGEGPLMDQAYGNKVLVDGDSIQPGFFNKFRPFASNVKKVYIGEGITYIAQYTFRDFCSLKEISFPNSLKYIGADCLAGCNYHFSKLYIPKNIKRFSLGSYGTIIEIDTLIWDVEEMEESVVYWEFRNVKNVVIGENVKVIPENFCNLNDYITYIEIPENVLKIGDLAFGHCSNLSSVVLKEGLEELGYSTLNDCPLITQLNLPSSLQILRSEFKNTSLVEITIPENVREINHIQCSTLKRVNYNARNATANGALLRSLEDSIEFYLGNSVEILNLSFGAIIRNRIDIPESVKYIGNNVFSGYKIGTMPPVLDYVGRSAFYYADFGDSLNLPTIGVIDNTAFSQIPTLKKLIINDVDSIKDGAFMLCPLEYVEVTTTIPPYVGSLPFYNTPITEIVVPSCECIETYEEKWITAKDTYVNSVSFVSKTSCDEQVIDNIEKGIERPHILKEIHNGSMVLSFPDGRKYNLLGNQIE